MQRVIANVVHLQRNVCSDEQQVDASLVQQRHEFAGAMVDQMLHSTQKDGCLLARNDEMVAAVVHADARIARCLGLNPRAYCPDIRTHET